MASSERFELATGTKDSHSVSYQRSFGSKSGSRTSAAYLCPPRWKTKIVNNRQTPHRYQTREVSAAAKRGHSRPAQLPAAFRAPTSPAPSAQPQPQPQPQPHLPSPRHEQRRRSRPSGAVARSYSSIGCKQLPRFLGFCLCFPFLKARMKM